MTNGGGTIKTYDAIVIGSGQGGKPLSQAFAKAGLRTALVERAHVGGTCINVGCTPTKTMVASARQAWLAGRGAVYGVHAGPVRVALPEVRRRKQGIVESFRNRGRARLEATEGLELLFGEARFTAPRRIEVRSNDGGTAALEAPRVVVNAGCRPADSAVPGLAGERVLDSSGIMELDEIPSRLLVLGGGYVGLEFSQMFRRFGSEVAIVQRARQLLPKEDPDVAEEVAKILFEDGIEVLLETRAVEGGTGDGKNGADTVVFRAPREISHASASHHGLGRRAADVDAGPADVLALDHRDLPACASERDGERLAGLARADDDGVVGGVVHLAPSGNGGIHLTRTRRFGQV